MDGGGISLIIKEKVSILDVGNLGLARRRDSRPIWYRIWPAVSSIAAWAAYPSWTAGATSKATMCPGINGSVNYVPIAKLRVSPQAPLAGHVPLAGPRREAGIAAAGVRQESGDGKHNGDAVSSHK